MIRVSCAIIVVDDNILICQRGSEQDNAFKWEFPGGKVRAGESDQECIVRELKEELNIQVVPGKKSIHAFYDSTIELIPFVCHAFTGKISPTEHHTYTFCKLPELLKFNMTPTDIKLCHYLTKHPEILGL